MEDFVALLDRYTPTVVVGQVASGPVVLDTGDGLFIDAGPMVSEVWVPASELPHALEVSGDISAIVTSTEDDDGRVCGSVLAYQRHEREERARQAAERHEIVSFVVLAANRGGLTGQVGGISIFVPRRHLPFELKNGFDRLVGSTLTAEAIEHTPTGLVGSVKAARKRSTFDALAIGDVVDAVAIGGTRKAHFVKVGEVEGQVPRAAWDRSAMPKRGQTIRVKVIGLSGDRLDLSQKAVAWDAFAATATIGDTFAATVALRLDHGVLVRLGRSPIAGLVAGSSLTAGDEIQVALAAIDADAQRCHFTLAS